MFFGIGKNNQNSGGAYIEKGRPLFYPHRRISCYHRGNWKIPIRYTDAGIPLLIKDVAEVRIGHAIRYGAMTFSDKGEVAGAVVLMLKGANAEQVVHNVKQRIEQIKNTTGRCYPGNIL